MNIERVFLDLLGGFGITIGIFFATLAVSLPLGLCFSFLQKSKIKPVRWIMDTFIWIIRGTPLMLQIIVVYYVPGLLGWNFKISDRFLAALIAFSINYACYFSVISKVE